MEIGVDAFLRVALMKFEHQNIIQVCVVPGSPTVTNS